MKLKGDAFETNQGNFFPQMQVKPGDSLTLNMPSRGAQTDAKMEWTVLVMLK